ncbi:MAG: hypothetical protein ABIV50_07800, partial [Opitutus sp.]
SARRKGLHMNRVSPAVRAAGANLTGVAGRAVQKSERFGFKHGGDGGHSARKKKKGGVEDKGPNLSARTRTATTLERTMSAALFSLLDPCSKSDPKQKPRAFAQGFGASAPRGIPI